MTTESAPRRTRTTSTATGTVLALLITALPVASACAWAVHRAPPSAGAEAAWFSVGGGVLLCAAVAVATHQFLTVRRLRRTGAAKDAAAASARAAAEHFADVTVPEVVAQLRDGASPGTALASASGGDGTQQRVLRILAAEVHRGESRRAAAVAACANAAGRVQALTTSMAADLRDMEHRYADPDVLSDLLHLDHRTARAGRLADSIAVLTGARSGRRWAKPIRMESILRGAMGRIQGYQRVRLHSTSTVAVAGHAAEGVMHALAELMDNAANFSPPTAEVHVYVEEVSAGVVITVEDGGLAMGDVALRRAREAVEPRSLRDLEALPGTRLGLSVVGRLAHKHGLTVSFRPSAHGGTGVLLRIPQELVTEAAAPPAAPTAGTALPDVRGAGLPDGAPVDSTPTDNTPTDSAPVDNAPVEYGDSGLPRRRRGRTLDAARRTADTHDGRPRRSRSAAESGSRLGTFRRAVRRDGAPGTPRPEQPDGDTAPPASPDPAATAPEDHPE
ncbi:sensor histidine kinase [Streptomyces sp. TR06-5]|uniref:sensor histidine kinase n=1 Tax=unclassified Streptomyces TaxID=2593676 RepID=UPI00399F0584